MKSLDKRTALQRLQAAYEQERGTPLTKKDVAEVWGEITKLREQAARCVVLPHDGETREIPPRDVAESITIQGSALELPPIPPGEIRYLSIGDVDSGTCDPCREDGRLVPRYATTLDDVEVCRECFDAIPVDGIACESIPLQRREPDDQDEVW